MRTALGGCAAVEAGPEPTGGGDEETALDLYAAAGRWTESVVR
ncbi:hypothetical protein AB0M39_21935 [Streptomyces sp. NPDC051907]